MTLLLPLLAFAFGSLLILAFGLKFAASGVSAIDRRVEEVTGGRIQTAEPSQNLEGVVKAKTADGKAQAYVLAGMPFALLAAIHMIDPHWLAALGSSATGYAGVGAASVLWIMGFLSAKKILAVDL